MHLRYSRILENRGKIYWWKLVPAEENTPLALVYKNIAADNENTQGAYSEEKTKEENMWLRVHCAEHNIYPHA